MKSIVAKQKKVGYNSSDSDSSDDQSWKKGINQVEQIHVLATASINPSKSNIMTNTTKKVSALHIYPSNDRYIAKRARRAGTKIILLVMPQTIG